jgi:glyoxalase superfamily protein
MVHVQTLSAATFASYRACMALHVGMVTIDSTDSRELAEFRTAAVDMQIVADDSEYVRLIGDRDLLQGRQRVSEPAVGKNRVHLDLSTKDRPAAVGRLVGVGASVVEEHEVSGTVRVDPDRNVFSVGAEG